MKSKVSKEEKMREALKAQRTGYVELENYRFEWTPAESVRLKNMFEAGYGISEIAIEFGRSERAVIQRINQEKLFREIRNKDPDRQKEYKCKCLKCNNKPQCTSDINFCQLSV